MMTVTLLYAITTSSEIPTGHLQSQVNSIVSRWCYKFGLLTWLVSLAMMVLPERLGRIETHQWLMTNFTKVLQSKMEPSCLLGNTRCITQEKFPKFVWSRWLDIGLVPFFCEKHAKKELGQYPGILTKHSVNNPCNYLDRTSWSTKDLL